MADIVLKNFDLLDTREGVLKTGYQVLVRDAVIAEVSDGAIKAPGAVVVDLGGRTLMPGLIDCHVHILARAAPGPGPVMLPSLATANASDFLRRMLMRGFTTARDIAGADLGHKTAVEQGLFVGPRLFVAGRAISQTGGHGDWRSRADLVPLCPCTHLNAGLTRIADGVAQIRHAVRDEIRLGADQIKIMAGGGVASPADPLDHLQFSTEEIEAVVDEATRSHTYVAAHVYTDEGIRRAIEAGVRTIEHGNFLGEETAALMVKRGAFLVPNQVNYQVVGRMGKELGLPDHHLAKNADVMEAGTRALEVAKAAGVRIAFGTDLFRAPDQFQCEEFLIRAQVMTPAEILHSATIVGAEVLRMEGRLGVIAPGALADLLAIDGNPLDDLGLLQDQGKHIPVIMKDGMFFKNSLGG